MKQVVNKNLVLVSLLHFLVDFICVGGIVIAYVRLGKKYSSFTYVFLLYNCFAFLLQPFFGLLVDHFKEDKQRSMLKALLILSMGILLIGFALCTQSVSSRLSTGIVYAFISSVILGCGNALFHVVGGKEALMISNKATPGGLYVSAGALGVGLASIITISSISGYIKLFYYVGAPILLVILAILYLTSKCNPDKLIYDETNENKKTNILIIIVVILCTAIAVRSFLGFYTIMSEDVSSPAAIFLLAVSAFMGKAIGGVLLDLTGPYITIGLSTVVATVLSIFLSNGVVCYIFIFSFNLLMPVTLDALRKCFPYKEGFAFGLAAAFLIPGYLLGSILKEVGGQTIVVPIICFITGAALIGIYLFKDKIKNNERDC